MAPRRHLRGLALRGLMKKTDRLTVILDEGKTSEKNAGISNIVLG
jgi:hypothetical protein